MSIRLFPHGSNEFDDAGQLARYLNQLRRRKGREAGRYNVIRASKYGKLLPGDIVIFHKDEKFVGHGQLKAGLRLRLLIRNGQRYSGYVTFDPKTIRVFSTRKEFEEIRRKSGLKVNRQAIQRIGLDAYEAILGIR